MSRGVHPAGTFFQVGLFSSNNLIGELLAKHPPVLLLRHVIRNYSWNACTCPTTYTYSSVRFCECKLNSMEHKARRRGYGINDRPTFVSRGCISIKATSAVRARNRQLRERFALRYEPPFSLLVDLLTAKPQKARPLRPRKETRFRVARQMSVVSNLSSRKTY